MFPPPPRPRRRSSRRRSPKPTLPVAVQRLEDRLLLSATAFDTSESTGPLTIDTDSFAGDAVLVRFGGSVDVAEYASLGAFDAVTTVDGLYRVSLDATVSVDAALATFEADAKVLYAERDYDVFLNVVPNDEDYNALWGLENVGQTGGLVDADIDAETAWGYSTGSGSMIVAVIDTGVDYTHQDLAGNMWVNPGEIANNGVDDDGNGFVDDVHGYDFAGNDGDPMDDNNHGTHVAGTIGAVANNAQGITGINWDVQIMAVKFLGATGSGSISNAIEALDYAVANGARLSNNSWGFNGGYSQALNDAIAAAETQGHLFVAAAGNGDFAGNGLNNDSLPFWPANHEPANVISVAATDHLDEKATFSNFGATTVDLGAPGVGILSTTIGNGYSTFSGTSMATPHVAGAAALLWDANPEWTYQDVIDRLYETVDPIAALDGITVTGGRLNLGAAMGPDVTGPRLVGTTPAEYTFEPFDSFVVHFSERMDANSITPEDFLAFTGPDDQTPIAITSVTSVAGAGNRSFQVNFASQPERGEYRFVLGPTVTDAAGNLLDQDRDGLAGEAIDDQAADGFDHIPFFARFDFGTAGSPVGAGFTQVDPSTVYTAERGFGWTSAGIDTRDRGAGVGDDVARDFDHGVDTMSFAVDVLSHPLEYELTLTMGDALTGSTPRDDIGIFAEGVLLATVTTQPGEIVTTTVTATVGDGRLDLELRDLGGTDRLVLINGLEINELGPDLTGPSVVSVSPGAVAEGSFDRFRVTFSESIDESTLVLGDVTVTGPSGNVAVTSIDQVSPTEYDFVLGTQTEFGDYTLTLAPNVLDLAGNQMDQDGDGIGGEAEDAFTTSTELVPIPPFEAHFDFGTGTSPVATDYTRVTHLMDYSAATGFGWTTPGIDSRDRGAATGDDLSRDFNFFTDSGSFAVDVTQNGLYDVSLVMGDGLGYVRDDVGVHLEETLYESVTSDGITYANRTYRVRVDDGQLNVDFVDFGGNPYIMLNALDVQFVEEDLVGPSIVASTPGSEVETSFDRFTVTFDEAIDDATFTAADVTVTSPSGSIAITSVDRLTATEFAIVFASQTEFGDYTLTIGTDVNDLAGNTMATPFSTTTSLVATPPFEAHFDFGVGSSPVAAGYTQVLHSATYSSTLGYGWTSSGIDSRDRGVATGDDLSRDFNFFTDSGSFAVDVTKAGFYDVTLVMGDGLGYVRDDIGISLEGALYDTVTSDGVTYAVVSYKVEVTDGQLNIDFTDFGGNPYVMLNGLDVVESPPDFTGPQVVATTPGSEAEGSLDRFTVVFDEGINESSLTVGDVTVTGPMGNVAVTSIERLSAIEYAFHFAPQTEFGDYTLVLGPNVADVVGNLMDQDGDGTGGESEDVFTTTTTLVGTPPFEAHFDFGPGNSPVATGYTQVTKLMTYNASNGFGWTSGSIDHRDRGGSTGDALERDFNFFQTAGSFAVDLPAGTYDVTFTMGDGYGYVRDDIGITMEGTLVDTVTADGNDYLVATYTVTVADGQLNIDFDDFSGNPYVMLNGLDIVEAGAGAMSLPSFENVAPTLGRSFEFADRANGLGPLGATASASAERASLLGTGLKASTNTGKASATPAFLFGRVGEESSVVEPSEDGPRFEHRPAEDSFEPRLTLSGFEPGDPADANGPAIDLPDLLDSIDLDELLLEELASLTADLD